MKLKLSEITLICVTGINYEKSIYALMQSSNKIDFAEIKIISPTVPEYLPRKIKHEFSYATDLKDINEYNKYIIYELWRHVETRYCLVVQADGYVIRPKNWKNEFLLYDYIGAPWPIEKNAYVDPFGKHQRVGNGGFSLRSKKLLLVPKYDTIPWEVNKSSFYKHMEAELYSEDGNICVHNRHIFEKNNCLFAPIEIAAKFSIESKVEDLFQKNTFGFHKSFPNKYFIIKHFVNFFTFKLKQKMNLI